MQQGKEISMNYSNNYKYGIHTVSGPAFYLRTRNIAKFWLSRRQNHGLSEGQAIAWDSEIFTITWGCLTCTQVQVHCRVLQWNKLGHLSHYLAFSTHQCMCDSFHIDGRIDSVYFSTDAQNASMCSCINAIHKCIDLICVCIAPNNTALRSYRSNTFSRGTAVQKNSSAIREI